MTWSCWVTFVQDGVKSTGIMSTCPHMTKCVRCSELLLFSFNGSLLKLHAGIYVYVAYTTGVYIHIYLCVCFGKLSVVENTLVVDTIHFSVYEHVQYRGCHGCPLVSL